MATTTTPVEQDTALSHVVLRPFFGGGEARVVGEVVDANAWRSAERLCETRYLRPLLQEDPKPISDGDRFFIDDDSLLAFHGLHEEPEVEDATEDDAQMGEEG